MMISNQHIYVVGARIQVVKPTGEAVGEVRGLVMHGGGKFAAIEFYGDSLPYGTKLYAAPSASAQESQPNG